jgi:hypothetical protein
MISRRFQLGIAGVTLVVTIYIIWLSCPSLIWLRSPKYAPLPPVADISEIKATYHDSESLKNIEFAVPQQHWDEIFDALLPAEFDPCPPGWWILGQLDIRLKNGSPFVVMLGRVSPGGAFAAGETFDARIYYRGGDSTRLEEALRAAYKASQDEEARKDN